jgi:hypothetical protein
VNRRWEALLSACCTIKAGLQLVAENDVSGGSPAPVTVQLIEVPTTGESQLTEVTNILFASSREAEAA